MKSKNYWTKLIDKAIQNRTEQNDLDFKSDLSEKTTRLKEHVNAFAHTPDGGCFVFGINDRHTPFLYTGDKLNFSEIQHRLSQIAQDSQEPPVGIDNFTVETSLGVVLCIYIHESNKKPVFIKDRTPFSGESCFKRSAANTVPLNIEEIRTLLAKSVSFTFDESPLKEAKLEDLEIPILQTHFPLLKTDSIDQYINLKILQDNNVICKSGEQFYPTLAGYLVFAKEPQNLRTLSNAYIEIQQFKDTTRAFPIKKQQIKGNISEMLEKTISTLLPYIWSIPIIAKNARRVDIPLYDAVTLREVIANALIHRDYTKMYFPIKIALFSDRLEIENTGGLMPGLTPLNILYKREWRNPLLAQLTKKMGYCEMDGQGIDRIYAVARQNHAPTPIFQSDNGNFTAIFHAPKKFEELTTEQKVNTVIVLLMFEKEIDNEMLREHFMIKADQASTLIKYLSAENVLVANSKSRKFARYKLSEKYKELTA